MKKFIISSITVFSILFAQAPRHQIGIEGGPSYTNMFGSTIFDLEKGKLGYLAGISYQYNFPKIFSIRTGFSIEHKGTFIGTFDDSTGTTIGDAFREINYLSIPILARFSFGKNKFKFFVNAGGYLGFIFDSNVRILTPTGYLAPSGFDISRFDIGATLGGGISYTIGNRINLSLEIRDNLGLYNLTNGYMGIGNAYTNSLYGLVGVSYNIGLR